MVIHGRAAAALVMLQPAHQSRYSRHTRLANQARYSLLLPY